MLDAFQQLVKKAPGEIREIIKEEISIDEKIRYIMDILEKKEFIKFSEMFSASSSKIELIVTLLALLELIRLQYVVARQSKMFGEVRIYRGSLFHQQDQKKVSQGESGK